MSAEQTDLAEGDTAFSLSEATVLKLEPGDVVVYSTPLRLSLNEKDRIGHIFSRGFDGHRVVVLDGGADLSVIRGWSEKFAEPAPKPVLILAPSWRRAEEYCLTLSESTRHGRFVVSANSLAAVKVSDYQVHLVDRDRWTETEITAIRRMLIGQKVIGL